MPMHQTQEKYYKIRKSEKELKYYLTKGVKTEGNDSEKKSSYIHINLCSTTQTL